MEPIKRSILRGIIRTGRQLARTNKVLFIPNSANNETTFDIGTYSFTTSAHDDLVAQFPAASKGCRRIQSSYYTGATLVNMAFEQFRAHKDASPSEAQELVDDAFGMLKLINQKACHLDAQTVSGAVTNGIRVDAHSILVPAQDQGEPTSGYFIRIENQSDKDMQITARHWVMQQGDSSQTLVAKGTPGVEGLKPRIRPGDCFQYLSCVDEVRSEAYLSGAFSVTDSAGESFQASVAPFRLMSTSSEVDVPLGSSDGERAMETSTD